MKKNLQPGSPIAISGKQKYEYGNCKKNTDSRQNCEQDNYPTSPFGPGMEHLGKRSTRRICFIGSITEIQQRRNKCYHEK